MDRRLLVVCMALLTVGGLGSSCAREESTTPAKVVATPAPAPVAPAVPPQAAAPEGEEVFEELYVDLEAEPDEGPPPLTVTFTSTIEDGTPPFTYEWDFGDGSPPSTEANPTHVYTKEGDFTATLTVKDSKGQQGSEDVDILVETE